MNYWIMRGYCPICRTKSLEQSKNIEYGGLTCTICDWKNVYYIGPRPKSKSKSAGSSSASDSNKPNSATIIDMTDHNKRYKTGICYLCKGHEKNGRVIDPTTDRYAQKLDDGSWVCGTCLREQNQKLLSLFSGGGHKDKDV